MHWIIVLSILSNFLFPGFAETRQFSAELSGVQAQYQFGGLLSIQAQVPDNTDLKQAILEIQNNTSNPDQFPLDINPDGMLTAAINLNTLGLQPFTRVYYWFDLTFSDNTKFTSASYWFDYLDNRFSWQTSTTKWFSIFWVDGDQLFGEKLQDIALSGLKSATEILPVTPPLPITIYVYPDSQSVQAILSNTEPDWVAGEAFPLSNLIVVSTSADINGTQDLERQIPHELTHLLENQAAPQSYLNNPAWLLEGLASNAETYPNPDYTRALQKAISSHNLLPISQLCHAFSPQVNEATLAYAESASFTHYLTSEFGTDKMMELLQKSSTGLDCSQLVLTVLGTNLDSLDTAWQENTFSQSSDQALLMRYWPILIIAIVLIITAILLRRFFIKRKEYGNGINK